MRRLKKFFVGLLCIVLLASAAEARQSGEWRKVLAARTAPLWVDAQFLDELVLNARARIDVTWLPRSLQRRLDKDREVDEWVVRGLSFYYSSDREAAVRMKGRDVIALNYRAQKSWTFDPTMLVIGGYAVVSEDLLGHPDLRVIGELPSGTSGTLFICVPALKPGRRIHISLGPDSADLEAPGR